jgi:hypothetical protein
MYLFYKVIIKGRDKFETKTQNHDKRVIYKSFLHVPAFLTLTVLHVYSIYGFWFVYFLIVWFHNGNFKAFH